MAKSKWPDVQDKLQSGLVEAWARDGLTDEQIAHNLGIAVSTLYAYKAEHEEFSEALKKGKDVIDVEVENALFKKALGYNAEIRKTFKVRIVDYDENGKKVREYEELKTGIDEVHIPADTTAQIFWLKNRKPAEWRDKREVEHDGDLVIKFAGDVDDYAN